MLGERPSRRALGADAPLVVAGARPAPRPPGRRCVTCGNRLSRYNVSDSCTCHACTVAQRERGLAAAQAGRGRRGRLGEDG